MELSDGIEGGVVVVAHHRILIFFNLPPFLLSFRGRGVGGYPFWLVIFLFYHSKLACKSGGRHGYIARSNKSTREWP